MRSYEENAVHELGLWKLKMTKKPSFTSRIAKGVQNRVNGLIPARVHGIVTGAIKHMVKAVLTGSEYTTEPPLRKAWLEVREEKVGKKLDFYKRAASLSGAGTGAGGFLAGLADFPILLSLKMKFLFDAAGLYGFDVRDYKERLYILYVFQLAFSSDERRIRLYHQMEDWENHVRQYPPDLEHFDWQTFQQEYRDYIDLAKLLQLVPGIGAVVGAYANYKLMDQLGETAMYAYRLRLLKPAE